MVYSFIIDLSATLSLNRNSYINNSMIWSSDKSIITDLPIKSYFQIINH